MSIHGECFDRSMSGCCDEGCQIFQDGKCENWEFNLIEFHDQGWIDDEEFLDYIDLYS